MQLKKWPSSLAVSVPILLSLSASCLTRSYNAAQEHEFVNPNYGPSEPAQLALRALEGQGIPYTVSRRAIPNGEYGKWVYDIRFGRLTQEQFATIKNAYGNISDVQFSSDYADSYELKDFLWPIVQATTNKNFQYEYHTLPNYAGSLNIQQNCWASAYEVQRNDPDHFLVFQNSYEALYQFFNNPKFTTATSTMHNPLEYSHEQLKTEIAKLKTGDVILVGSDNEWTQEFELDHVATVIDSDLIWERTGGATTEDRYRFVNIDEFNQTWNNGLKFSARRFKPEVTLPDARWVLDFTQSDEGFTAFLGARKVKYNKDSQTEIRSLPADVYSLKFLPKPKILFDDLVEPEGYPAIEETGDIYKALELGLVAGCRAPTTPGGYAKFCPHQTLNRATMVVLLSGALGELSNGQLHIPQTVTSPPFPDVPASRWYSGRIAWAKEVGLSSGRPNGTFDPEGLVTRAEMAVFLKNAIDIAAAKLNLKPAGNPLGADEFTDISGHWAQAAVEDLANYCDMAFAASPGGTDFKPNSPATRREAVRAIVRFHTCLSGQ